MPESKDRLYGKAFKLLEEDSRKERIYQLADAGFFWEGDRYVKNRFTKTD